MSIYCDTPPLASSFNDMNFDIVFENQKKEEPEELGPKSVKFGRVGKDHFKLLKVVGVGAFGKVIITFSEHRYYLL